MFGNLSMLKEQAKMMKGMWMEYALNEISDRTVKRLQEMGYSANVLSIDKNEIKIDTDAPDELKKEIFKEVKKEVIKELKKKRKEAKV